MESKKLLRRVMELSKERGESIAAYASLKTQLSRWENGHVVPKEPYRSLLRDALGDNTLAFVSLEPAPASAGPGFKAPPLVLPDPRDPAVIDYLYELLQTSAMADNKIGPKAALFQTYGYFLYGRRLLVANGRGERRADLLRASAWQAGRLAWLYVDTGDFQEGARYCNYALRCAQELEDGTLAAYSFTLLTHRSVDMHNRQDALAWSVASLRNSRSIPAPLRGLARSAAASAYALAGDYNACVRALGEATTEVVNGSGMSHPYGFEKWFDASVVEIEALGCWVELGRPQRAINLYQERSSAWPAEFKRNRGLSLSRMASAHAVAGNIEEACRTGLRAIEIARSTQSYGTVRQLVGVQGRLPSRSRIDTVLEFREAMADLLR